MEVTITVGKVILRVFYNFPAATNGLALANIGMAVMIHGLCARLHNVLDDGEFGLITGFTLAGVLMLVIYYIKILLGPMKWFEEDSNTATPIKLAMIGTLSMATCLLGKTLTISQFNIPMETSVIIVLIGGAVQLYAMVLFFYSCYKTSTWPEPFWNNAVHSVVFPAVCLPGNSIAAHTIRSIFLSIGLFFLLPNVIIMSIRVLMPRKTNDEVVANNPTVAVLQAACSITCTGWFNSPLTKDAVTGIGGAIGHTLFAFSTVGWIFSVIGIWQRRKKLWKFDDHPIWVGFTFPFANTAICACVYRVAHPEHHYLLTVWVYFLSAIAAVCIIYVNWMFMRNFFFAFSVPPAPTGTTAANRVLKRLPSGADADFNDDEDNPRSSDDSIIDDSHLCDPDPEQGVVLLVQLAHSSVNYNDNDDDD